MLEVSRIVLSGAVATNREGATDSKDFGDALNDLAGLIPKFAVAIGVIALFVVFCIVCFAFARTIKKRISRASLVVRVFLDGAVGPKVGPGVAALIEERLVGALRRKDQAPEGYDLDLVSTDVEMLSEDNDLTKALGSLADMPQLQMVVGVMDLLERLLPSRGLSAAGELLPAGSHGAGIAVALYRGNSLQARSALWEEHVKGWLSDGVDGEAAIESFPSSASPRVETNDASDPTAVASVGAAISRSGSEEARHFYDLAVPAAWWVQYEAARTLGEHVSLVTDSGPSFALVGIGLARERYGLPQQAEEAYTAALDHDPDNIAALANLAQVLARDRALFAPAALLLVQAMDALRRRHERGSVR